ncbi:hypothetical protein LRN56_14930, partial [Staphylococcus aureus]|nr:hypothetical protein [Staphylococcus aureus]
MWGFISGRNTYTDAAKFILPSGGGYSLLGGYKTGNTSITGVIDVLDREGLMTILAEPNLPAVSGETASFLAGGEFPIPVAQTGSGSGGSAAITVE